jgi:hypothetical protein
MHLIQGLFMATNLQNNTGLFIPDTNVWDIDLVRDIDVTSDAFKELLVRLYQNINNISLVLNIKDSAYYVQQEFLNGQSFFPNTNINFNNQNTRQAFRMVVNFGPLPDTSTISIPHGIEVSNGFTFTRIYGASSNQITMQYIPLPYASPTLANNIQLDVDATNVTITTGSNRSSYTTTYVILEYIKE